MLKQTAKPPFSLQIWFGLFQDPAFPDTEGAARPSVSGVYFTCPLTGAVVRRDQKEKHVREAIQLVSTAGCTPLPPSPLNPSCGMDLPEQRSGDLEPSAL